ncbi:hypothetical protein CAC42_4003 [Sphaceloma murrayae]|uniref:F-box domain-containing protein n=1 Tax=Sphaceloma murrayae TaxID=2082308 RepID=A0A2K1QSI9_9PEZI|nr:hypothetical protein CAC42_4003 [Sphaceloma murrayae]
MVNFTDSAVKQVFDIPELLELILSNLPNLDLLLSQRTCHRFHDLISTSPKLQRLLFMRPDWTLEGRYSDDKPGTRPLNNLMLRQIMGGMYPTMTLRMLSFPTYKAFSEARDTMRFDLMTPHAFPSLDVPVPFSHPQSNESPTTTTTTTFSLGIWAWTVNVSFPTDTLISAQKERPAIAYECASWRKMYMSQPPATELHLCRRWRRAEQPAVAMRTGITMDDLVRAARDGGRVWNEGFISSDRDWHLEGPIRYSHFGGRGNNGGG